MELLIQEETLRDEIFLEPDEKYLCTVGSPQLQSFLKNGALRKGFAVLSDRAIYCKGKCRVSRDRSQYSTRKLDYRIDLQEFQDMKHLKQKNPVLLSLAFFFLLLAPALVLLDKLTDFSQGLPINPILDAAICVLLAGVFFLLYSIHKKSLLELIHTNGSIGLDLRFLPEKEARLFIRFLRAYLSSFEHEEAEAEAAEAQPEPAE